MTRGTAEPRFCGSAVLRFSVLGSRFCDSFGQIEAQSATYSQRDRKSTRLNSSHRCISYAVFCLKKKITLPVVDPMFGNVSFLHNVLTFKCESKSDHDTSGKDSFVREVAYGALQRRFSLPECVIA